MFIPLFGLICAFLMLAKRSPCLLQQSLWMRTMFCLSQAKGNWRETLLILSSTTRTTPGTDSGGCGYLQLDALQTRKRILGHTLTRFILGRGQEDCWHAVLFLWNAGQQELPASQAGSSESRVISVHWCNWWLQRALILPMKSICKEYQHDSSVSLVM